MSIGTSEIFLCLVIALLVLGPEKLPGAARQVGRIMAEFKRITGDVQSQVQDFIKEEPEPEAGRPTESSTTTSSETTPPVAGRPANAPLVEPPDQKHPGTEGFRLIDEVSAQKPINPTQPEKPVGSDD